MGKAEVGRGKGNRRHAMRMTVAGKVWRDQPRRLPDRERVLATVVVVVVGSADGDAVGGF